VAQGESLEGKAVEHAHLSKEEAMAEDRILTCKECGRNFTFTAGEQEFYAEKGFQNDPARCPACRRARKAARYQMYSMTGSQGGYTMYRSRRV
jgi:uncharacterized protein with PIN domain